MSRLKKIRVPLSLRFRDLDAMGHVNNAVFFTYFEEGRKDFLHRVLGVVRPEDYFFILAKIDCEFLAALTLEDTSILEIWIGKIGKKSFTFRYRILDKEDPSRVFATGESIQVFFDYQAGCTMQAPAGFTEKASSYVEAQVENPPE